MLRAWKWYQSSLAMHPVKTQMVSSALIWGFGDIAAQTITHSMLKRHRQIQVYLYMYMYIDLCVDIERHVYCSAFLACCDGQMGFVSVLFLSLIFFFFFVLLFFFVSEYVRQCRGFFWG